MKSKSLNPRKGLAVLKLYIASGTYNDQSVTGNVVVNTGNVILKDMVIEGNLYLAEGIGQGNVTLDSVAVKGTTFANSGGENSIMLQNTTLESLFVEKRDGKIRILAKDSTVVAYAEFHSGATLKKEGTDRTFESIEIQKIPSSHRIILDGDYALVNIEAPYADIEIVDGIVDTLNVADTASGSNIQIAQGAAVKTLTADAPVGITGKGQITNARINASGVSMEQKPDNVTLAEGVSIFRSSSIPPLVRADGTASPLARKQTGTEP